ncbi:MAG TPA: MMPL family transporter, partial [Phycisphaeraceae bacterium]
LIVSLLIGIAWSFGFLTLTIGHLQVISVVFVTMLLGLGVAFGIHIASRYELIRHRYPDTFEGFREALADTLITIGPGIVTGAVTTAAAFCTTMLTDFRGVAEMGAIAGAGILLCLIAMTSVFPALLRIFKPNHKHLVRMEHRFIHIFEERWVMPFAHHPRWTLAGTMVVAGLSLAAITQMRFDYNLLELLPTGVDSVEWYRRIEAQGEQSVWSSVSIAPSLEEARERAQRFRALGTVGMVRGIGELFPEDEPEKLAAMAPVRAGLADALEQALAEEAPATQTAGPATQPDLVTQLTGLRLLFGLVRGQIPPELGPQLASLEQSLDRFLQAAAALAPDERAARLQALQRDYQTWRREVARQIAGMLDPSPLQPNDLPPRLLSPYIATDENGQTLYALEIHPALPAGVEDVLDPRFLGRFIQELKRVDPAITGVVVQIYESGELIWKSYLQAGIYALIAVFVLVWFDFQSLRDALLSLAPVAAGFAVTFAVMYLVGMQINPANIVVLPLMFGIGVDAGVHILHRYRQDPTHRPLGLTAGTGKGITLTSYTTMVGFGSLLIAHHRGIAGLGFVLMTGIGLTLLACWTLMPAWLELRAARTPSAQAAAQRGTSHS